MTRVYGPCIEPDGMELESDCSPTSCPKCGKEAKYSAWQELEGGSINFYEETVCGHCGYVQSNCL